VSNAPFILPGQDIFSSLKGTLQNAWNDYLEFNDIGLDAAIEAEEMDKDKDEDENDEEEDPASTVQRTNRVLETWLSARRCFPFGLFTLFLPLPSSLLGSGWKDYRSCVFKRI